MNKSVTQEERLMAALAHGAILLSWWGLIVSIIIWVTQREKSEFVRREVPQAIGWQLTSMLTFFAGMFCYMLSIFSIVFGAVGTASASGGPPPDAFAAFGFFPFCVFGMIFLLFFSFIAIGFYGAYKNLSGESFEYPLVGRRVTEYLAK